MYETMYAAPGIGLAATQVDQHIRLLVLDVSEGRDQPLCHGAKSHRFHDRIHIAHLAGFLLLRTVLKAQFDGGHTSRRESQGRSLGDTGLDRYVVLHSP